MNGGLVRNSRGFTIIETMIVLAVSMALFLSAAALINGKQRVAAFNQSVGALRTQILAITNEVGSGFYPNDGTIVCTASAAGPVLNTGGTNTQGTNEPCLFLGKVIQFGAPSALGSGTESYYVYTLAGLKSGVTDGTVSLLQSKPRVIARGTSDPSSIPNAFDLVNMQYGLSASQAYYTAHPGSSASLALITNLSSLGAGDGSQRTDVVALPGTKFGLSQAEGTDQINNMISTVPVTNINPAGGVKLCFNSGGTNQSALFSIGGAGRQGIVDVQIFNNPDCT